MADIALKTTELTKVFLQRSEGTHHQSIEIVFRHTGDQGRHNV